MSDPDVYRRLAELERRLEALSAVDAPYSVSGTFTPTFTGSTTAGTFTYTAQRGAYVRVGSLVAFSANVIISAITVAPVGNMRISGLPFAAGAPVAGLVSGVSFGAISQLDYPAGALQIIGRIDAGQSVIQLFYAVDNAANVPYPAASFTNANCALFVSGVYPV